MTKSRLDTEKAFKSIIGNTTPPINENKPNATPKKAITPTKSTDKLFRTAFYITKQHYKALKMRAATSDMEIDKDQSAIVRAALDNYLADILK
ncbi:MAG: hypothetical protein FWG90_04890 [Oscillospiraceae bacterium]|nr:hypothetical protein [Oscillospiraceae bacterium]